MHFNEYRLLVSCEKFEFVQRAAGNQKSIRFSQPLRPQSLCHHRNFVFQFEADVSLINWVPNVRGASWTFAPGVGISYQ